MAKKVFDRGLPVDAFISSTATRAFTTAEFFATAFGFNSEQIIKEPELYHASPEIFSTVVAGIKDEYSSAALFSHNPGITDYVNSLTTVRLDNMPTCGVFAVEAPVDHWADFKSAEKKFLFFDYPKM